MIRIVWLNLKVEGWRFTTTKNGVQYAMPNLHKMKLMLHADKWDLMKVKKLIIKGKFIGSKGNTEECLVFNGNNHCGPDDQEIHAIASECEGNEKNFKDCFINYDTSKCNHMMDSII